MTLSISGCNIKNKSVHVWYKQWQENMYLILLNQGECCAASNLHGWGTWQKGLQVRSPLVTCVELWVMSREGGLWQFCCFGPKFTIGGTVPILTEMELLKGFSKVAFNSSEPVERVNSSHDLQFLSLKPGKYLSLSPPACSWYHCATGWKGMW